MQGLDLTAGPAHCPRSAWPPCCCSSSQDNAGNCVNALSSEGVEQGNSGQEGLMGGLLSALMCITALLAGNRSVGETMVKWFQVPTRGHTNQRSWSDNRKIIDDQSPSVPLRVNLQVLQAQCVCLCVQEAFSCRCCQVIFQGLSGERYILLGRQKASAVWYQKSFEWSNLFWCCV